MRESEGQRLRRLAEQDARFQQKGEAFEAMGDAQLAAGIAAMRRDPRLPAVPGDPEVSPAEVDALSDDALVGWALQRIALAPQVLAAVMSVLGGPASQQVCVHDIARYEADPSTMPIGKRMVLAGVLGARNPGAQYAAALLTTRSRGAITAASESGGRWLRSHVPSAQLDRAGHALQAMLLDDASAFNIALQTEPPAALPAAFHSAAQEAARRARAR